MSASPANGSPSAQSDGSTQRRPSGATFAVMLLLIGLWAILLYVLGADDGGPVGDEVLVGDFDARVLLLSLLSLLLSLEIVALATFRLKHARDVLGLFLLIIVVIWFAFSALFAFTLILDTLYDLRYLSPYLLLIPLCLVALCIFVGYRLGPPRSWSWGP